MQGTAVNSEPYIIKIGYTYEDVANNLIYVRSLFALFCNNLSYNTAVISILVR